MRQSKPSRPRQPMNMGLGRIGLLLAAVPLPLAPSAFAQVSANGALVSDDRFRGHSITNGDPAVTVALDFDDSSGFYFGADVTAAIVDSSPAVVNVSENLGYAHRLKSGTTIDVGVVRSDYTEYYSGGRPAHFTEFYAGFQRGRAAGYLRYSPDYVRPGVQTLYGEFEVTAQPAEAWRLNAHLGLLVQIAGTVLPEQGRVSYDWKLGVVRQLNHFELGLAVSGGGSGPDYYQGHGHERTALVASLRWHL